MDGEIPPLPLETQGSLLTQAELLPSVPPSFDEPLQPLALRNLAAPLPFLEAECERVGDWLPLRSESMLSLPSWPGPSARPREETFCPSRVAGVAADKTVAHLVASMLESDVSPLALHPTTFSLKDLCREVYDPSTAQPARSSKGQQSAWKHWSAWCAINNTPEWRLTRLATDVEYHREAVLQAGFLRFCHNRQSARPRNGRKAALVSSSVKTLCHVRKMHKDRGYPMCSSALVATQVRRLNMEYKSTYGVADMVPKRKEPFTRDVLVNVLLSAPDGTQLGNGRVLRWDSRSGRSLRGLICVLAQTGFRKGEVSVDRAGDPCDANCLSRGAVQWLLRGKIFAGSEAPPEFLANPMLKDCVVLTPCPSKSDPFDMVWGGEPIWLPFLPSHPLCAFSAIADIEVKDKVSRLEMAATALFTDDNGLPFSGHQLDQWLKHLLRRVLPERSVKNYSWHSARIYLATSLLAANASHAQIQALCRWQTDESLKIYARLSRLDYVSLIQRALETNVTSARTQQLSTAVPFIDLGDLRRANALITTSDVRAEDLDLNVDPDDDADDDLAAEVELSEDRDGVEFGAAGQDGVESAAAESPAPARRHRQFLSPAVKGVHRRRKITGASAMTPAQSRRAADTSHAVQVGRVSRRSTTSGHSAWDEVLSPKAFPSVLEGYETFFERKSKRPTPAVRVRQQTVPRRVRG